MFNFFFERTNKSLFLNGYDGNGSMSDINLNPFQVILNIMMLAFLAVSRMACISVIAAGVVITFNPAAAVAKSEQMNNRSSTIIVGGDYSFAPYEFLDKEGQPAGYNVELTKAIAEVMGVHVQIRLDKWSTVRNELRTGQIDVLQGMVFSESRNQTFDFSPPHTLTHQSIFSRKGAPKITSIQELNDKEVIVQNKGIMHDYLLTQGIKANLILVDTHADALRLLSSGKHQYAVVANLPGLYLGRELKLTNIVQVSKQVATVPYCYAVKKGNSELLTLFSEGLAIIKNTGRHQIIYDKWLGGIETSGLAWDRVVRIGLIIGIPILLLISGIVIWNRSLQKRVTQRTEELRQHQQQLLQADKMASLGILVAGVAHEINNPNSLILFNTPVLIDSFKDAHSILEEHYRTHDDFMLGGLEYSRMREEIPPMLQEIMGASRKIKRIVEDLKDFARQGDSDFTAEVDFNEVVKTSLRLVENSIKKATSNFQMFFAENLPLISANAQRVEQVVVNLILNACQALPNTSRGIAIRTYMDTQRYAVALEICDEGSGIAHEHLPNLTDPFFTTRRNIGGTGLGLSVSYKIIQEHGGNLDFKSSPGQGTTATLTLPIIREKPTS